MDRRQGERVPHLDRRTVATTGTGRRARRVGRRLALVLALLVTTAATCVPSPGQTATTVATGLDHPWGLAIEPEGRLVFTERDAARINIRLGPGHVRVFGRPDGVATSGEGGLMGLALHPRFHANRLLYVCFSSTAGDVRVVRYRVSNSFDAITDRLDVVTGIPYSTGRHSGCQLAFGPDDKLWITTGDAAIGSAPQDLSSLGGKVLRVNGDGSPVADNPFVGVPGADDRIYTYGHRNPQGISFDDRGRAYTVEHGPSRDDEINRLVFGGNYGWNPVPGYSEGVPMTDRAEFPDAIPAVWSSGSRTIAPGGATFVDGEQWTSWEGGLAVAVLKDRHLRVFGFDDAGTTAETYSPALLGHGLRLRNVVQGHDGSLYVATDVGGGRDTILRLRPR